MIPLKTVYTKSAGQPIFLNHLKEQNTQIKTFHIDFTRLEAKKWEIFDNLLWLFGITPLSRFGAFSINYNFFYVALYILKTILLSLRISGFIVLRRYFLFLSKHTYTYTLTLSFPPLNNVS